MATKRVQRHGEPDMYVRERESDFSFFGRTSYWIDHYKLLLIILSIAGALGFVAWTPGQVSKNLQTQIDTNRLIIRRAVDSSGKATNLRIDKLDDSYQMLNENMHILIRRLCVDKTFSDRDRALTGLTPEKCR